MQEQSYTDEFILTIVNNYKKDTYVDLTEEMISDGTLLSKESLATNYGIVTPIAVNGVGFTDSSRLIDIYCFYVDENDMIYLCYYHDKNLDTDETQDEWFGVLDSLIIDAKQPYSNQANIGSSKTEKLNDSEKSTYSGKASTEEQENIDECYICGETSEKKVGSYWYCAEHAELVMRNSDPSTW